jgi:hypothetical protein
MSTVLYACANGPDMTTTRMGNTIAVLNRLEAEGVIGRYAITGAVAAYRHISAALTEVLDLLVSIPSASPSGLLAVAPIFARLRQLGYADFSHEGIIIEGWPVQFLPVASDLDAEALERAEPVDIPAGTEGVTVQARSLRPEHLVATALKVGRPKDLLRIQQFLEERTVDLVALQDVLRRYGLIKTWRSVCRRLGVDDPLRSGVNE